MCLWWLLTARDTEKTFKEEINQFSKEQESNVKEFKERRIQIYLTHTVKFIFIKLDILITSSCQCTPERLHRMLFGPFIEYEVITSCWFVIKSSLLSKSLLPSIFLALFIAAFRIKIRSVHEITPWTNHESRVFNTALLSSVSS